MSAPPIRWGILGTGNIAGQFCKGVGHSQRGSLAAVGSRQKASAETFARAHDIAAAHGDYDLLLADANVDAVYISLPNSLHHSWTIKALRAGKHVLCEKPIAMNAAEAAEMFDVARQSGRVLAEAFMYRSNPLTLAVKRAVDGGAIGQVRLIRTSFCYRTNKIASNIRFDTALGGGGLMDIGCYCINFSRHFADEEPTRVTAAAHVHESGVDDLVAGTLQFPSGVLASFNCGMIAHADNTAYLCGSDGFIEVPVPWKPPMVEAVYVLGRGIPPKMDGGSPRPQGPLPRETVKVPVHGELYGMEADDFATAVLDGTPPRVTAEDSIGNMRVLDQVRTEIGFALGH